MIETFGDVKPPIWMSSCADGQEPGGWIDPHRFLDDPFQCTVAVSGQRA